MPSKIVPRKPNGAEDITIRLDKHWTALIDENVQQPGGQHGIYQLGNEDGDIPYIGVAGAAIRQ